MNIAQVENNVISLIDKLVVSNVPNEEFIYELLLAYGHRASTISMLRNGHYNIAKGPGEIIFKRHLYFKQVQGDALHAEIDQMKNQKLVATNRTRFVICTNFTQLLAIDTKTGDSLDIALTELPRKFDFFLPWAGMEKAVYQGENPADVKAAEKMAKLFDLIKADNFDEESTGDETELHNLNVFLTRLLFCFFAEDTEIFSNNQFSDAIQGHTSEDGDDLAEYLNRLFVVLNTPEKKRGALPDYLSKFPYVNGGLFADDIPSPAFSRKSRRMLIECGSELNWSDINPDIFGSMIQAVVHPDQRGGMGMHYTSVTNIMKVIEPLFLNDLYEELDRSSSSTTKLQKLQQRLGEIKIFDPACGSGNFLIIAYKELRRLEMELLKRWQELELNKTGQVLQAFSVIKLSQFYGIELDDFAHEVALLSLWLAEHQMNMEFKVEFGRVEATLPLKTSGGIVSGNSTRLDWKSVCDNENATTYVIGNPPYLGQPNQTRIHASDLDYCFRGYSNYKKLDYVACWFIKAARYICGDDQVAFVSTNSISQGMQVSMLWPKIFEQGVEISFAHRNFKWSNNAKDKAQVTCSIIGFTKNAENRKKYIHEDNIVQEAHTINAYLTSGANVVVDRTLVSISNLPKIVGGNQAREGGYLILSDEEKKSIVNKHPNSNKFFKRLMGTSEFTKGIYRWCIWIEDSEVDEAIQHPEIKARIEAVRNLRENGNTVEINFKNKPHQFVMRKRAKKSQIIIPEVSSEKRKYIPCSFIDTDTVVTHKAQVIYDSEPYIFSIIMSHMHMIWVREVGGRLGTGLSYSVGLCYNTFPFPKVSTLEKETLTHYGMQIILARESHPHLSISELYDPKSMPNDLAEAHDRNDKYIESLYKKGEFSSDLERITLLFKMYSELTGEQNA